MDLIPDAFLADYAVTRPLNGGGSVMDSLPGSIQFYRGEVSWQRAKRGNGSFMIGEVMLDKGLMMWLQATDPGIIYMESGVCWVETEESLPVRLGLQLEQGMVLNSGTAVKVFFAAGTCRFMVESGSNNKEAPSAVPLQQHGGLRWEHVQAVQSVKRIIDEQFSDRLLLPALARRAAMNAETLRVVFKTVYGQSIHQYQIYCRIRFAYEQLVGAKDSVEKIARRCGYRNVSHFTEIFKRMVGRLPSACRKDKSS